MYGAIIGDIVGSKYEFHNIKTKDFPFVSKGCTFTDDTVMTIAVAEALLKSRDAETPFQPILVQQMQKLGREYPNAGYGGMFARWLRSKHPEPYYSYGNGSAMRVSPCGLIAVTLEEAVALARASAEVTHNHPEGIKGAEATAAAIFLARVGKSKEEIRAYICEHYYKLTQTLDEIRPHYYFNETCQNTVPQAIIAFLESENYEDAIRNAISIGGDSDTLAAITGGIAWSFYRFRNLISRQTDKKPGRIWPEACDRVVVENGIDGMLPAYFLDVIDRLDDVRMHRMGTYGRTGFCSAIPLV